MSSFDLEPAEVGKKKLPKSVVGLGYVSLFTDISSEAIFPLLPAFLTSLGASNVFIGLIEGAADLVSNVLKYVTGLVSDRHQKLKPFVLFGYGLSTTIRPLVAFAALPWHVLLVRIGDRVGKGVRTTPRDALIAEVTDLSMSGRAFGFHRAMDHAGAALGTLLGAGLLWWMGVTTAHDANAEQMREVFLWAAIPGFFAMIALALIKEQPRTLPTERQAQEPLTPGLKRALLPIALFACANATDAFILVKAARLGASPILAPLLWFAIHIVKAATATFGGRLADRYGKRNALALGWSVYALTWGMVGFAPTVSSLFVLGAIYGTSHGLVEGAEKALVAQLSSAGGKGKAFGVYNMMIGLCALGASTTFGFVWDQLGSEYAFAGSGGIALVAALVLMVRVPAAPLAN